MSSISYERFGDSEFDRMSKETAEEAEPREYSEKLPELIEQATGEFIIDCFNHVQEVDFATREDDSGIVYDQKGFDMVLVWDNGMRMAVDVTVNRDTRALQKKMSPRLPLVMQHLKGPEGEKIVAKDIPQATVSYSPEATDEWYQAREQWMANGRKGKISDWLQAPLAMQMEILAGLYRSFEDAARRHPAHAGPFTTAIKTLASQAAEISAEAANSASSRRELREVARRIKNPLSDIPKRV